MPFGKAKKGFKLMGSVSFSIQTECADTGEVE